MKKISEYRDYSELLLELKKKYGIPKYPYFKNKENYTQENRIKRGKEGLYIHHDREDTYPQLSVKNVNIIYSYPFECHNPENLTYANALEHLMLHILIAVKNEEDSSDEVGIRGIILFMVPQINTYLANAYDYKKDWLRKSLSIFDDEENKEEYYKCLEYLISNYHGSYSKKHHFAARLLWPDQLVDYDEDVFAEYLKTIRDRFIK